jgi:hypothetical protein
MLREPVPEDELPVEEDEQNELDLAWDEDENEERRRDPLRHKLPE